MKFTALSLAATASLLIFSAPVAEAGQFNIHIDTGGYGRGFSGRFGGLEVNVGRSSPRYDSCYLLHTVEVHRRTERRQTYDERGRRRTCRVTVVTYEDHYSNGSVRTYTRTYS